jgi:hypothetical protein
MSRIGAGRCARTVAELGSGRPAGYGLLRPAGDGLRVRDEDELAALAAGGQPLVRLGGALQRSCAATRVVSSPDSARRESSASCRPSGLTPRTAVARRR